MVYAIRDAEGRFRAVVLLLQVIPGTAGRIRPIADTAALRIGDAVIATMDLMGCMISTGAIWSRCLR